MSEVFDVKALRQRISWKQDQLAEFLGVDRSTVSHLENGRRPSGPVARLLSILAEAAEQDTVDTVSRSVCTQFIASEAAE